MSRILCFLLFFIFPLLPLFAEQDQVVRVRDIPPEGLLLQHGWKYKVGDEPDYASPDFDDGVWEAVDPTVDIHDLPMLWKDSVVWFRIYLDVDSTMIGDLAITVGHAGASEIYLDGKLIMRFGVVSSIPNEITAYDPKREPTKALPLRQPGRHVLAVRYALEPSLSYTTEWANSNLGLSIKVYTYKNAQQIYYDEIIYNEISSAFRVSAYLLLSIIFLAFYVSNRKLKTNLLFFVYALTWTVVWKAFDWAPATVKDYYYFANASLILQVLGSFVYLTAIYNLFFQRKNWIFYLLIAFGLFCIPLGIFFYDWGWKVFAILFIFLLDAEILRVSVLSLKRGVIGAGIIVFGAAICIIMWAFFNLSYLTDLSFIFNVWFFFSIHHLSIPVAVSIYLGYNLGFINKSLESKLDEIKVLSAEKEQILTSQKDRLEQQVAERTRELQESLENLQSTQAQLIQSEKMASLGELTAGIAHEIQNPLNFVNNFSEVSAELVEEIKEERSKKQEARDETLIDANLKDVHENLEKVKQHGKRADAIVKGMLEHSRKHSGEKVETDINALAEEYLKLSYHGMRAKDKSFTCDYQTDLDPNLPKIKVIPQDIGRVLLNIINNAFHACTSTFDIQHSSFDIQKSPKVTVSTKSLADSVQITVSDNGPGIPDSIKDKIFQPFFTTKPTGQGTGLGLSLAYDIVKAHGGELSVETRKNEGATFKILFPLVKTSLNT